MVKPQLTPLFSKNLPDEPFFFFFKNMTEDEFAQTFMTVMQTFTHPARFLAKLVERYNVPPAPEGTDPDTYVNLVSYPIRRQVCNILSVWFSHRFDQDFVRDPILVDESSNFIREIISIEDPILADSLLKQLAICVSVFLFFLFFSGSPLIFFFFFFKFQNSLVVIRLNPKSTNSTKD